MDDMSRRSSKYTVHPHVCGEHIGGGFSFIPQSGSSPRVWGTFTCAFWVGLYYRFIPTCVGNILKRISIFGIPSVHPHVCGEHAGKCRRTWRARRFIPTCVGNMPTARANAVAFSVHPHVCGEHAHPLPIPHRRQRFIPTCVGNILLLSFSRSWTNGSSPRVWGTLLFLCGRVPELRFIPTCVGNMKITPEKFPLRAVHPHVCGEHFCSALPLAPCAGSSPRVWGTCAPRSPVDRPCAVHPHVCGEHIHHHLRGFGVGRFIPTCVGNIALQTVRDRRREVHPHVCGEHCLASRALRASRWFIPTCVGNMRSIAAGCNRQAGSSPRVWGTFPARVLRQHMLRFIPTCVGNMRKRSPRGRRGPVHPHVCGEHVLDQVDGEPFNGSSPRVWGT